jgi:hypothetical protein
MWQLHVTGRLDILPDSTRHALKLAEEVTRDREAAFHCTIAIGYDGPEEIVNAVRSLLEGRRVPATASTTSASCCGGSNGGRARRRPGGRSTPPDRRSSCPRQPVVLRVNRP